VADLVALLMTVSGLVAVLSLLAWLARRVRRRGVGGTLMGPIDEIYNPGAHRSRFEIQAQARRGVALPSPDTGGDAGRPPPERAAGTSRSVETSGN
jgi:hypothetical protein